MRLRRSRLVDVTKSRVVKLMPNDPPSRGDIVIVDGVRCRVVRSKVSWEGNRWTLHRLRVVAT